MDYDLDRKELEKALKVQRNTEKFAIRPCRSLIFRYAAEMLRNQKKTTDVFNTIYSFSLATVYIQKRYFRTKEEMFEVHKIGWWIYRRQKQRDTRQCIDCKYSYIDDLYEELCCENQDHLIEKGTGLAENDPMNEKLSKPCCKYYSD